MDKKIKPADNPADTHPTAQSVAQQKKGPKAADLESWALTSEQRKFIESLQSNDHDSESDC